ncbi:cas scaffolding protein family member 4 [Alosa pseudoharengus]|uniref:cas scaffolding protein family member 4 n=1 Tax=Alosa pseudoharengus TaxID=34774 RepID=UPI003F89A95B
MENVLAKALYDNTAECSDELAFRKGDILTVMDQNVAGSIGWWKCSLHGRQGLAPANRLLVLSPSQAEALYSQTSSQADKPSLLGSSPVRQAPQSIYQVPSVPRNCNSSPAYECMERIYEVPSSAPHPACWSPGPLPLRQEGIGSPTKAKSTAPSPTAEVYDVPSLVRKASLVNTQAPNLRTRKSSLASDLEKRYEIMDTKISNSCSQNNVYAVPPSISPEPNYDIPVPATIDAEHRLAGSYSTLPIPRKSEWIYDVPAATEKSGNYGTMPAKVASARVWPPKSSSPGSDTSLYDIPKPSPNVLQGEGGTSPTGIYDIPPGQKQTEGPESAPVSQEALLSRGAMASRESLLSRAEPFSPRGHVPLECRANCGPTYDHPRGRLPRGRLGLMSLLEEDGSRGEQRPGSRTSRSSTTDSQRISTASTSSTVSSSSTSSCDSLALSSSSSPELLREVTLAQDEVCRRLAGLQDEVCRDVPRLMLFVSSRWRCREHLAEHLPAVRAAAEAIASSVTHFLNFASDVRGNARRLTDANLQARLLKQLSIVEDSGLILQQAVEALDKVGWKLDILAQDPGQAQTPDQLERFVMVARTMPEDIKRLVSILNANGKLLFRLVQKEPESPQKNTALPDLKKDKGKSEQVADPDEDDNDYVQLQKFEQKQKKVPVDRTSKEIPNTPKSQACSSSSSSSSQNERAPPPPPTAPKPLLRQPSQSVLSEHCRLYFGALQRAINEFVSSILAGQPPEAFISHSKLVIMVGQKLVNTLCNEAHKDGSGNNNTTCAASNWYTTTNNSTSASSNSRSDLLHRSNHLCALLKQLAVATKKAALHFPDQLALQEAQTFAKELAQRAMQFRQSLEV